MAGKGKRKERKRRRPRAPRWLLPVIVLGVVGFLYVRPITTYLETRSQLDERRAVRIRRRGAVGRLERKPGLAAPTGAGQRNRREIKCSRRSDLRVCRDQRVLGLP